MPARQVPARAAPGLSSPAASSRAPISALALSAFGALMGGLFPISVIFSLGDIGGGLSASADDTAWLVTVYNVGQILGQPLLMITAGAFGRGVAMRVAGAGFVISSLAVAFAPGLDWAIAARLVQGVFGGVLPTFMMLLVMTSPLRGRAQVAGLAVFSLASSAGLGLAAGVAAWLIELGGWRALFWGQALAGLLYTALAFLVLPGERGDPRRLRATDWSGYGLLSLALGLLVIGVSEGERHFWFEAWWVTATLACGTLGLVLALRLIPQASPPLLRLDVIAKPTLGWALIFQLFFRFGLMFGIVVAPQYLVRLQGYRVEQLGPLLLPLAVATLVAGPVAWWTVCRFDPRLSLSLGLASFALAAARAAFLSSDWAAPELFGLLVLIGVGQAFVGVALLRFATFEVHPPTQGPTVGIAFNYARVFGLAVGVAAASHTLVEREKFHSARLGESLNLLDGDVSQRLAVQAGAFANWIPDPAAAQRASVASLARATSGQAFAQGFGDAFAVIAAGLLLAAILVWALPRLPAVPAQIPDKTRA
ncbi:MFS transporter [Caulobacter soli]|uniref:MFS transporter n=1 Tax=Caulobacter soli TaxID=2708539 RepID=UPI0013ECD99A|nr:MFS transporter [Caulobacter soli]